MVKFRKERFVCDERVSGTLDDFDVDSIDPME
jgi:hypothetical protein